jgi:hypothetical protein
MVLHVISTMGTAKAATMGLRRRQPVSVGPRQYWARLKIIFLGNL